MKRYLSHIALLGCAALAVTCSKVETGGAASAATGTLEMKISTTRADAAGQYDPFEHLVVRIRNSRSELIRKYDAASLPERLELIAGEYTVAVEAGERADASFTQCYYRGEKTFAVVAGQTAEAEVACKLQNAVAEVKFDPSVGEAFGERFRAWVVAADAYDEEQVQLGRVPALEYTADAAGYFTLPEGVTTLTTRFEGTHPERGEITYQGRFDDVLPGGKYVVTYKFSKDLPGFVTGILLRVDTSTDERDDTIIFTPDPSVAGDGFDMNLTQDMIPHQTAPKSYRITGMAPLSSVSLEFAGKSYDLLAAAPAEGIEVTRHSELSLSVTLGGAFFANCPGGSHTARFRVADTAGAEASFASPYRVEGLLPVSEADYDLWTNRITLRALVLDPAVTATSFGLRLSDGSWREAAGSAGADGIHTAAFEAEWTESTNDAGLKIYTPVAGTGVFAGNSYEARLTVNGERTSTAQFTAAAGQIIPDGDMENASLPCFGKSTSESTTFWGSGNAATTGLCSQGTKAGMGGEACAKLESQSAFGMLAAGNLFSATFRFASLKGTVGFGMPYDWQARPTALRLKYHATVGAVNKGTAADYEYIRDGQDRSRIFVAIVDWTKRHETASGLGDPTGTWDPVKTDATEEGAIIACGSLLIDRTTEGDALIPTDIPIVYYDRTTRPTGACTLVISCSTSAYGDYKVGCLGNVMYVDDFEWVY